MSTESNGRLKISQQLLIWLLTAAMAVGSTLAFVKGASKDEVKSVSDKAEATFVRKETFEEYRRNEDERWRQVQEFMKEIRDEMKRDQTTRRR